MTALRELLARFTIDVDPEGNLPKGNRLVDGLRDKLKGVDGIASGLGPKLRGAFGGLAQAGGRIQGAFQGARDALNEPRLGFVSQLGTLQNAFAALGIGIATRAMWGFVDSTVTAAADVNDMAQRLGVTTDQFQELQTVAALGGATIEDVGTAFTALTRNAEAFARTGEGEAGPALQALGLQVRDANGELKPAIELFYEAGAALNALDNATQQQALVQKLLGESGRKLLPVFNDLASMTAEQRAEVRALSIVYGEDFIQAAAEADDQMLITSKVIEGLKARFIGALLPAITGAAEGLQSLTKWLGNATRGMSLSRVAFIGGLLAISPYLAKLSALVTLGGGWMRTLGGMGRALAGLALRLAPVIAAFLVLEDVFGFLTGVNKSATGRLLDTLFGDGTGKGVQKTIQDLTAAFKDLWNWITGNGQGEKAKALYREIVDGIELIVHDMLVNLGIRNGSTGLAGLNDFRTRDARETAVSEQARSQFAFNPATGAFIPVQGAGERQGTTVIDNSTKSVQVNMSPGTSPAQVADAVSKRLEADRNSIADRVP